RYDNAPNWEKDLYWFILPDDKKQDAYRIPKPFSYGTVFGSGIERTLDAYVRQKPDAYKGWLSNVASTITPGMVPTIAKPVGEQIGNYSLFQGRPLESPRVRQFVPSERYYESTPGVLRAAGRGISKVPGIGDTSMASPIMLENYIR